MSKSSGNGVTPVLRAFLEPRNVFHRQYEALRARFVEGHRSSEVAARFGYSPGSFRVLCSEFRKDPSREFFRSVTHSAKRTSKMGKARATVIQLRKENLSIDDIARVLSESEHPLSRTAIGMILREEGFARLPRRLDEERPSVTRPTAAAVADVRELDLEPRTFHTKFGGLFLFLPFLVAVRFDALMERVGLPGTQQIPAGHAMRSLLALKLAGTARKFHVMSQVMDEGLGVFAGLNVIPKRSYLAEYSCRINPFNYPKLMRTWYGAMSKLGFEPGHSFDLDFHTIPFHGEDALMEKHYVSKRSRRQKGILAFVAQDADKRVFCYANGQLRKDEQNDEILRFLEYWKARTGHWPEEVVFDSKLTTYGNLHQLNKRHIQFITLRRRTEKMLDQLHERPLSAWRRIELENIARAYRTPKIIDEKIDLSDYEGKIRQIIIEDLGHEEPTYLLTNQLRRSAVQLVGRYAQRMIIENSIADAIDFFHMDALSSAVHMKVNCDLQLTLMASTLYRHLGTKIGNGYQTARARTIFNDFVDATATISITKKDVIVRFQKRAHSPLLRAAGIPETNVMIPWLGGKRLTLDLG